jgi:hypothetical protein
MWDLARAVPDGEAVDLPNAAADPVTFGMLMALLQRTGHDVTGQGQVDYFHFSPPEGATCYAVLRDADDPASYGYAGASELERAGNLVLYAHRECVDE